MQLLNWQRSLTGFCSLRCWFANALALSAMLSITLAGISSAHAAYVDWVRIDNNDEFTTYVDYGNINRSGDLARIWDMRDYKKPHTSHSGESFSSQKSLIEADCKGERFRLVGMTMYAGSHLSGKVVEHDDKPLYVWSTFSPGTVGQKLWRIACNRR